MEQAETGVSNGVAQYLSDLLAGLPLPQDTPQGQGILPPNVVRGECGAVVALFCDPVPPPPLERPAAICAETLYCIAGCLSDGASLWETAGKVGLDVEDVARAVTTLGGFTTKRWRGSLPPRATEPLGEGFRRSRKHPYSLERSAVTIRGSHAAGELDADLLASAAERLAPPDLGAEDLAAVLGFWVFRQKLRGAEAGDPPPELAGAVRQVAATTRDTVNAAAGELVAALDGQEAPTPHLDGLAPSVADSVRADSESRCSALEVLRADPAAYLPVRFRDLCPQQVRYLGARAARA